MDLFKQAVWNDLNTQVELFLKYQFGQIPGATFADMEKCRRKIEDLGRVMEEIERKENLRNQEVA